MARRLQGVTVFEIGLVDAPAVPDAEFIIIDDDEHAEAVQAKAHLSLLRQGPGAEP